MQHSLAITTALGLLLAACPAQQASPPSPSPSSASRVAESKAESRRGAADPCSLLTSAEIEAIQGEPVTNAKSSGRTSGGFVFSECFFSLAEFTKSVSLQVTRTDPTHASPVDPARHWKELFGRESREDKDAGAPVRVDGVGEEAFWVGDTRVGALYVLQGQTYFRISAGGWADEQARLEKSTALAKKALSRL